MEVSEDEVILLRKENATLKEKVETLLQEDYKIRQTLTTCQLMKSELEFDAEELHSALKKYKEENEKLTSEGNEANRLKSKVLELEMMLKEKDESSYLPEIKEKSPLLEVKYEEDSFIHNCLTKAENQVEELSKELNYYKTITESYKTEELDLKKQFLELNSKFEEVTTLLQAKTEDHRSCLESLEILREEKALMTTELAMLRHPVADGEKRGNSLFSEVEDNRQIVQAKFNALKNKYESLKQKLSLKNIEFNKMKTENLRLINELKVGNNETFWNDQITAYKERIRDLQESVNYYSQRKESPQIIIVDPENLHNLQWVNTVVESARQEVRKVRQEMEGKSALHCFESEQRCGISRENRQLKYEVQSNNTLINDLKSKLEESKSLITYLKLQLEGNSTLSPPGITVDQLKISDDKQKKIRFSEDTKDKASK